MSCRSRKAKQVCETPLSFAVKLDPCRPCPWALSPHRCPLAVRLRRVSKGQHAFICQPQTSSEVCTQSKPQNPNILLNPTAPLLLLPNGCQLLLLEATNTNLKAVRDHMHAIASVSFPTKDVRYFPTWLHSITLTLPILSLYCLLLAITSKKNKKNKILCIWTTSLLALKWEKIPCFLPDGTFPRSFRFYSCIHVKELTEDVKTLK